MAENGDASHLERDDNLRDVLTASKNISEGDKYFMEQRSILLQDILNTMGSVLNGLNELNISLENSIAVGKEFETVTELWRGFYNDTDPNAPDNSDVGNTIPEFKSPSNSFD